MALCRIALFTLSFCMLALAPKAQAGDRDGNFAIKGVGLAPCADYLVALEANDPRLPMFLGWVSGYLTSFNQYEPNTYDIVDWQSDAYIMQSLRGFCAANKERRFFEAAYQMAQSLKDTRVNSESPLVIVEGPSGPIRLYRSTLDEVRAALESLGLLDEQAHGRDALTRALTDYQKANGLKATGAPDNPTLYALLVRR
ncbi:hypothetical protein JCM17844_27280 [Iodidimonas gelatinilytica]|uniref:Peptidoglycan binding-like domain-containing protein n=2 Tax=Iodidimonas gelatinilytica TaxID=1236966 RepID=A0A5A7MT14_9PROT|nr:peptidoglycan-binding domain-containing protein [Iodidimonas gelatinilytica]GEQ99091.1 hypothetical protein JCM17844_27280 [Iodidimonas gelatinilytica]GER00726.1 hypothetical protein JCM17845_13490 [Iodidimonas gelatinilytica]